MSELRKSKRMDYAIDGVRGYRYDGANSCSIAMLTTRGSIEVEKFWSRQELVAAWQLLGAMLSEWPVEQPT